MAARVVDAVPLGEGESALVLSLVRVDYAEGEPETYAMPMAFVADGARAVGDQSTIVTARIGERDGSIVDVPADAASARALMDAIAAGATVRGRPRGPS